MATSCGIYRATEVSNDKAELFYDRDPHTMSFKVIHGSKRRILDQGGST